MNTWISVEDRLPHRAEFILLGWDGEQYIPYDKIDRKSMSPTCKDSQLTHWMPLPPSPKQMEEEMKKFTMGFVYRPPAGEF